MNLCQYKELFGKPRQESHTRRIPFVDLALSDTFMTIFGAYIASLVFGKSFLLSLFIVVIIGIIMHRVFCVRTRVDELLFPDD